MAINYIKGIVSFCCIMWVTVYLHVYQLLQQEFVRKYKQGLSGITVTVELFSWVFGVFYFFCLFGWLGFCTCVLDIKTEGFL